MQYPLRRQLGDPVQVRSLLFLQEFRVECHTLCGVRLGLRVGAAALHGPKRQCTSSSAGVAPQTQDGIGLQGKPWALREGLLSIAIVQVIIVSLWSVICFQQKTLQLQEMHVSN